MIKGGKDQSKRFRRGRKDPYVNPRMLYVGSTKALRKRVKRACFKLGKMYKPIDLDPAKTLKAMRSL